MPPTLDISLVPMVREAGQDLPNLPGLYTALPPRRTARRRNEDRLIIYLELIGGTTTFRENLPGLLKMLASTFYDTPGAITAALRSVAETLNTHLIEQNRREKGSEPQLVGLLSQVVLHGEQFYLAQSGLVQAYWITRTEVTHLYEPSLSGRGLGIGQSAAVRYFHALLQPNDVLLLAANPSPNWTPFSLEGTHGQGPEGLRRKLFDHSLPSLNAIFLHAHTGKGQLQVMPVLQTAAVVEGTTPSATLPESSSAIPPVTPPVESNEQPIVPQIVIAQAVSMSEASPLDSEEIQPVQPPPSQPLVSAASPVTSETNTKGSTPSLWLAALVTFGQALSNFFGLIGRSVGRFLARLFPEELFEIPPLIMAVIAITVPIIVLVAASVVYFQLGRASYGRQLYTQAGEIAVQALNTTDPLGKRTSIITALTTLDQSKEYGGVAISQVDELWTRLNSELDSLDHILRVNYQPAIMVGLDPSARITRMVVSFNDLYLLDGTTGKVLRALETPQGYALDAEFQCGSEYGQPGMGSLVGLISWINSTPQATVMAMDGQGKLIFCQPGEQPSFGELLPSSTGGLQDLATVTQDRGALYVLDPPAAAVWIYPSASLDVQPNSFFAEDIPSLDDAIDLAVNYNELYLLHGNGSLTFCLRDPFEVSGTKCVDPQPYVDYREGRLNMPFAPVNPFSQIYSNASPDPSLYLLEPEGQAIFHFSLRSLGFLQEYRPAEYLAGGKATAFFVSGLDRMMFLAAGNQVYYGIIP